MIKAQKISQRTGRLKIPNLEEKFRGFWIQYLRNNAFEVRMS